MIYTEMWFNSADLLFNLLLLDCRPVGLKKPETEAAFL